MSYLSKVITSGDGSTRTFNVPFPYLDKTHVKAKVDGAATTAFIWLSPTQIEFTTAPPSGTDNVEIYRDTPTTPLVVWPTVTRTVKGSDLNTSLKQKLHLAQEAADKVAQVQAILDDFEDDVAATEASASAASTKATEAATSATAAAAAETGAEAAQAAAEAARDEAEAIAGFDGTAATVGFAPAGGLAAVTVQAALVELDSEKAASAHTHDDRYYTEAEVDAEIGALEAADATKAAKTQTDFICGLITVVEDQDYRIAVNLPFGLTITKVTTRAASGTCTLTAKINTTALGGTANSVSSTEEEQAHASANVAAAGDDIVLTVSATAACEDLSFMVEFTRTLS